ncbi:hypothetical protein BGZ49_000367 [Haplosporangium sp. Z 27]|nr:hypothetical protein BGZ49_000367 [Haplosporangium sp. Z 27]
MVESQEGWTVKDLYRGLVPNKLINSWKQFFRTTTFIATYMATMFVSEIEEFGRTGIWYKKCEDTIAWEKLVRITTMSKRDKGHTGNEGHQRGGGDFSDLTRRRVRMPNVIDVKELLPNECFNTYWDKSDWEMMERLQGLKTNLLTLSLVTDHAGT